MATKVLNKTIKYGLLKQTNWATPQTAAANFKTQNWDAGVSIPDPDVLIESVGESGQYGIHKELEMFFVDSTTGLPKISFRGRAAKSLLIDYFAAAFFKVVENSVAPYDKTISAGGLTAPIDFKNDGGYVYTVAIDNTGADDGIILENAILNNLKMTLDLNARGLSRHLTVEGEFVGNKMSFEQTLSGSWVAKPTSGYYNDTDTFTPNVFTINGVDYSAECIKRFEIEVQNNVTPGCLTPAGKVDQYDIAPVYTLRLLLDYNAVTEKIPKQFTTGGTVLIGFPNSVTPDTDGELKFYIPNAKLIKNPVEYNGDFLAVAIEAEMKSGGGSSPIIIDFTDNINGGFPTS